MIMSIYIVFPLKARVLSKVLLKKTACAVYNTRDF